MNTIFRFIEPDDQDQLLDLYLAVAKKGGGIIRYPFEINQLYILDFLEKSRRTSLILAAAVEGRIVGEIHAFMPANFVFRHLLLGLTIVVHPDWQGQGIGRQLFERLLVLIKEAKPDILRVELYVRSHYKKAIALYRSLGFQEEGALHDQIFTKEQILETPLMMTWRNPNFRVDALSIPGKNHRISLCPVQEQDLKKLSALANEIYRHYFVHLWKDGGEWYRNWAFSTKKLSTELQEVGTQWYLCYHQGGLVGFLKIIDQMGINGFDQYAIHLERIYLLPSAKGQGIGKAMLKYIIQQARQLGRQYIWLKVMDSNQESIAFYQKNQFEVFGKHQLDFPQVKKEYQGMLKMRRLL